MKGSKNNRPRPNLIRETKLLKTGLHHIAGLDEAGRGAWAGPVVAAAVILPLERFNLANCLEDVRDSKLMTALQRSRCYIQIHEIALSIGIGEASADEIDQWGIISATRTAMQRAIEALSIHPEHLLIDHLKLPNLTIPQTSIPKGDRNVLSIAAASVIAKVTRDDIMRDFEETCPGYGFSRHKGYGTYEHRQSLALNGPSIIHRKSFAPIACRDSHTA
jgi:ribonuclease HII